MRPLDIAARLLCAVPNDFYCEPCLAATLQVPVGMAREIGAMLGERASYTRRDAVCVGCGRTGRALAYIPVKCVRCSRPVDDGDLVVSHGEQFHQHCWQILESSSRIADSQQMTRLSRELIRRSLERLRLPPEQH